jgi:hypothetical protein
MTMTKKKQLMLIGIFVILFFSSWLFFRADLARWRRAKEEDLKMQQKLNEALDLLKPTTPTSAEVKAVIMTHSTMKVADGNARPVFIAKNFLPLMEARKGLPAVVTCVRNYRDKNGLHTLFWSEQARYAIEFDWQNGSLKKCRKPDSTHPYYSPTETPTKNRNNVFFSATRDWSNKNDSNEYLFFTPIDRKSKIKLPNPWNKPVHIGPLSSLVGYKYGAATISDRKYTGEAIGLAIFNVENPAFCGESNIPKQSFGTPLFVVDSQSECVLCIDDYAGWMVCVDLAEKQ